MYVINTIKGGKSIMNELQIFKMKNLEKLEV